MSEFELITFDSLEIDETQIESRLSQIESQLSAVEAQLSAADARNSAGNARNTAAISRNLAQLLSLEINTIDIILEPLYISEEHQTCVICMETKEKDDICSFDCMHTFCKICIEKMILKNIHISCPLCRKRVEFICTQKEEIQQIFNEICL
jgi:hypothetical protein